MFQCNCGSFETALFFCQLTEATLRGLRIRSVVPHVVEVCSREQELALPQLHQMAAKTAAYMGQALSHRNAAPYHVQVSDKLHSLIIAHSYSCLIDYKRNRFMYDVMYLPIKLQ